MNKLNNGYRYLILNIQTINLFTSNYIFSDHAMSYNDQSYESDEEELCDEDYFPDEKNLTRFTIALCELYNEKIHGRTDPSSADVLYHFLVCARYKKLGGSHIIDEADFMNGEYNALSNKTHRIFDNYRNIVSNEEYIKPEIVECVYLPSGHCVAILKTFWIKIIQRTWKNVFKKRQFVVERRRMFANLRHREIYGTFPNDCKFYPTIKGMLSL